MRITCYRCKKKKDTKSFSKKRDGEIRGCWQGYCKPCTSLYYKALPRARKQKYGIKYRKSVAHSPERILKALLRANTVDRSALDFEWAWNILQTQDMRCAVTNIKFEFVARSPLALSIDRIDPNKGYTKDNVRFVCWWVNAAMGNWGLDKLNEFIKEWKNV